MTGFHGVRKTGMVASVRSKIFCMAWHSHSCLCGAVFRCRLDILPTHDSYHRAWCREFEESVCSDCLNNIQAAQGNEALRELAAVLDPSASHRARLLCGDL